MIRLSVPGPDGMPTLPARALVDGADGPASSRAGMRMADGHLNYHRILFWTIRVIVAFFALLQIYGLFVQSTPAVHNPPASP